MPALECLLGNYISIIALHQQSNNHPNYTGVEPKLLGWWSILLVSKWAPKE